jgi:hypothetical protein
VKSIDTKIVFLIASSLKKKVFFNGILVLKVISEVKA